MVLAEIKTTGYRRLRNVLYRVGNWPAPGRTSGSKMDGHRLENGIIKVRRQVAIEEIYFSLSDIQTAVFEFNGKLSILPVSKKRPANPEDLNLSPAPEFIHTEVIMDG